MKRVWARFRRLLSPQTPVDRNIYLLYGEVMLASVLAAAGAFNAPYILRAGGSSTLVGLLSSLPALIAVFLFLPAGHLMERQRHYGPLVVWSLLAARIGYLFIALWPSFSSRWIPEVTTAILIAMAIPSVIFATGWSTLLADVIPENRRTSVLAWRSILSSAIIAGLTSVAGMFLDRGSFPRNYQWLYLIGLMGGLLSVWLVARIKIPETTSYVPPPYHRISWWQGIREGLVERPEFGRLTFNTFLFNLGAWMIGPLYIIFFVRDLGAPDRWVGLYTTLVHIAIVLGYWFWRRISQYMGDFPTLLVALPVVVSFPFWVSLVPHLGAILFIGFAVHLFLPGVDLNHSLLFMATLPPSRRHTAIAFYSALMNLGAFVCPLIGVELADLLGIRTTLVLGGILRLVGMMMFYLRPLDERRPTLRTFGRALAQVFHWR